MKIGRDVLILCLVALAGCGDAHPISSAIDDQFSASGRKQVNLASSVPGNWDRVCILGPYSNNADAAQALGFQWPAETLSEISTNDRISLLIFVQDRAVTSHVDHSRARGDFSNLRGRCFPRDNAVFLQVDHPDRGWSGLFPANEA